MTKLAYSVNETLGLLSLGRTKFYELVESGEIKTAKVGKKTLVLASEIQAFLDRIASVQ